MKEVLISLCEGMQEKLKQQLEKITNNLATIQVLDIYGKVLSAKGVSILAAVNDVKIGDLCLIQDNNLVSIISEVVSINKEHVTLLPFGGISGISNDCRVKKISDGFTMKVGEQLLGKVIDGFGRITGNIAANATDDFRVKDGQTRSVYAYAPDPLNRPVISSTFSTGIKSIDGFITCGKGQRIGIFAGPGMGKTTLMGMILRNSIADVVVIALIGERGREVREFIEIELANIDFSKCVLVVATSDRPPIEQLKCAYVAQTICEYFREQGKSVLLFMDSITRFARAGREVGLSSGESISRGGYPPSVFASFPKLMERAGVDQYGAITAFYTVLMEGENLSEDAIADEIKSIIDGHIVLSKALVEQGHFPAIDILKSLSRVGDRLISEDHVKAARHLRLLLSKYAELEFLIRIGEYKAGEDAVADEAINKKAEIMKLLKQSAQESCDLNTTISQLISLANA